MQDDYGMNPAEFRDQNECSQIDLQILRDQLDRFLAADYDKRNLANDTAFNDGAHHIGHFTGSLSFTAPTKWRLLRCNRKSAICRILRRSKTA